jgi:3D-(3,5/4)-trihydroxycyclohexane-1,2-dione acylhydrolase (decyclizing)
MNQGAAMSLATDPPIRLTVAQALVKHLVAQRIVIDQQEQALFGGVFAIFGHGNVICLGEALNDAQPALATWRGQNEQSMGFAAVGYAKAHRRQRICVATSSVGPGATNMVTAAAVAHANRLPVLFLSGDVFHHRLPQPVLQQLEHFHDPSVSVNDAFKPVTRFWDRITHPAQLIQSLPAAIDTMLDPADCGPAFLALPQDVQGIAYDFPAVFLQPQLRRIRRPRPDAEELEAAARVLRSSARPIIIAGGGVHYSLAAATLAGFADRHGIPVVETIAGMSALEHGHGRNCGTVGVTGTDSANILSGEADVVLAIGTRLQDFTTGSWTVFSATAQLVALNAARFDASKHRALPLVADAREGLDALDAALGSWRADPQWTARASELRDRWHGSISRRTTPGSGVPSYAQVIGAVNRLCSSADRIIAAAGGLPGELAANWQARRTASVDIEYGYSTMGYEIGGAWGARIAQLETDNDGGDTIVFVGDGSYLLLNSDIYSSVLTGRKLIIVLCDNGGFAVIDKLQRSTGNVPFNNMIADCNLRVEPFAVDFAAHARSMGARAEAVNTLPDFEQAFRRAKASERTYLIEIKVDPCAWTEEGHAWWDVGTPEVSGRSEVLEASSKVDQGRKRQRRGV